MMDKEIVKEILDELVESALETAINNNDVDIESISFEADEDNCYVNIFATNKYGRVCLDCFNGVTLEGQQMLIKAFEEKYLIMWERMQSYSDGCDIDCEDCDVECFFNVIK